MSTGTTSGSVRADSGNDGTPSPRPDATATPPAGSGKRILVRGSKQYRLITLGALAAFAVLLLVLPLVFPPFQVSQFTNVIFYAITILGLNLLTGYNGQISLGHSAFFGVGAYTAAILISDYDVNYLLTIPVAAAITFVLGYLFGVPALRLKGLYLALVTLALAVVFVPIVRRFEGLTGGVQGISISTPESPVGGLADDQWLYYVCLTVGAVMFLLAWNLVHGRIGRAMVAVRDNEIAAETMGVNIARTKTLTFAYSAMYAGIGGALYTFAIRFVSPESFTLTQGIGFLAALVIGGVATISGAVFGALFIQYVPAWASDINPALGGLIYGLALIVFMLVAPGGIVGLFRRFAGRFVVVRGAHTAGGRSGPPTGDAPNHPVEAAVTRDQRTLGDSSAMDPQSSTRPPG